MSDLKVSTAQVEVAKFVLQYGLGKDERDKATEILLRAMNHGVSDLFNGQ
jgi:hypothetical protein